VELDFLFNSVEEDFNSDESDEEEAPEGGNYVRPGEEEEEWMRRAARCSRRSEAEHRTSTRKRCSGDSPRKGRPRPSSSSPMESEVVVVVAAALTGPLSIRGQMLVKGGLV
jgi:hypothetical protein